MDYELIIGNKNYSSWSMRPWVVLKHFNIPFKEHLVYLKNQETIEFLKKTSKNGKVPCLIVNSKFSISDSLAICEYLAEEFENLWPKNKQDRANARAITSQMHSGFDHIRSTYNMNIKRKPKASDKQKRLDNPDLDKEILQIEQIWSEALANSRGKYLYGDFCIADAFFAPIATRFKSYMIDLSPISKQYMDTLLSTPAIENWIQDALVEDVIIQEYEV